MLDPKFMKLYDYATRNDATVENMIHAGAVPEEIIGQLAFEKSELLDKILAIESSQKFSVERKDQLQLSSKQ